jgi:hypothetical protein
MATVEGALTTLRTARQDLVGVVCRSGSIR